MAAQKLIAIIGQTIVLIFAVSIFIIGGSNIVINNMQQTAPALGPQIGLRMGHVYLALPIAGAFMIIFTVERILELVLSKEQGGLD